MVILHPSSYSQVCTKSFGKNFFDVLADSPANLGTECHAHLSDSFLRNRALNPLLAEEVFLHHWADLVCTQTGIILLLEEGIWDVAEGTMPENPDYSRLLACEFLGVNQSKGSSQSREQSEGSSMESHD